MNPIARAMLASDFVSVLVEFFPDADPSELARLGLRLAEKLLSDPVIGPLLGGDAPSEFLGGDEVDGPFIPEGAEAGE